MPKTGHYILFLLLLIVSNSYAQTDSTLKANPSKAIGTVDQYNKKTDQEFQDAENLKQVPDKYIKQLDKKMDVYNTRMTQKTIKTLQRLSKWENKIHTLLLKTSPQTAQQLFANGQETFATLLVKVQQGQNISQGCQLQYDQYTDNLSTNLKYLQQQKGQLDSNLVKPVADANSKMAGLTKEEDNTEAVQQFIKTRKKQLADGALKYLQNSKYLANMNQESFYYIETMKNYKQLFDDPDKAEKAAVDMLDKMPAYQSFAQQNSMLSSLFGFSPGGSTTATGATQAAGAAGIQTRTAVQNYIQQRIPNAGLTGDQMVTQNVQQAQDQMGSIKDKLNQLGGGSSSDINMPEGFKPNMQKTKTLAQRIEYGFNIQFARSGNYLPSSSDLALTIGYKLSDKNTVGFGVAYSLGLGNGLSDINLTSQGIGLRSYIDTKFKGSLWITGGYEQNYQSAFSKISELQNISAWQQSGLIGISEKYKGSNMQILWDFLSYSQVPQTAPIKFRMGYTF